MISNTQKDDLLLETFPLSKVLSEEANYSTGVMGQYLEGYIRQRCSELRENNTEIYFFYTKLRGTDIQIWGMTRTHQQK